MNFYKYDFQDPSCDLLLFVLPIEGLVIFPLFTLLLILLVKFYYDLCFFLDFFIPFVFAFCSTILVWVFTVIFTRFLEVDFPCLVIEFKFFLFSSVHDKRSLLGFIVLFLFVQFSF